MNRRAGATRGSSGVVLPAAVWVVYIGSAVAAAAVVQGGWETLAFLFPVVVMTLVVVSAAIYFHKR